MMIACEPIACSGNYTSRLSYLRSTIYKDPATESALTSIVPYQRISTSVSTPLSSSSYLSESRLKIGPCFRPATLLQSQSVPAMRKRVVLQNSHARIHPSSLAASISSSATFSSSVSLTQCSSQLLLGIVALIFVTTINPSKRP